MTPMNEIVNVMNGEPLEADAPASTRASGSCANMAV